MECQFSSMQMLAQLLALLHQGAWVAERCSVAVNASVLCRLCCTLLMFWFHRAAWRRFRCSRPSCSDRGHPAH